MKALPALSLIFLFLTVWAPFNLNSCRSFEVGVIDIFAMFLAIFLSIILWVRLAKRRAPGLLVICSICTLASTVLSGVACYYAGPRGGNIGVGVMVMLILIPGGLVVAAITLVTCITVLAVSLTRARVARPPALPAGLDRGQPIDEKLAQAGPPLNRIKT
jgi:hypothetical protein